MRVSLFLLSETIDSGAFGGKWGRMGMICSIDFDSHYAPLLSSGWGRSENKKQECVLKRDTPSPTSVAESIV